MLEEMEVLRPYGYGLIYSSLILYAFMDCTSYGAALRQLFLNLYFQFGVTPRTGFITHLLSHLPSSARVEQYVGEIKGGLRPAMRITIIGMVPSNPKSFSVTLLCDPVDANKDVGMIFTVNFSEKSITRNARIDGKWGIEEKNIPYFPFIAGETFKMELLCEHQQIKILLDGRQLCDFTHRIQPLNLVKALQIAGDVKLTKVA